MISGTHKYFAQAIPVLLFVIAAGCSKPAHESETKTEPAVVAETDPLPSWNAGATKDAIIAFVKSTTDSTGAGFVPVSDRIACFDNDGTLWSEQPYYFQLAFVLDRIKVLAPSHPEWTRKQPFKAVLENDLKTVMAGGEKALVQLVTTTHDNISTTEFDSIVNGWILTARNPATNKLYKEMVFQPMLELLAYLRTNGFKTFIVSGGGIEFMRAWAEGVYGIPPEQVVGSSGNLKYEVKDGVPQLTKLPEINFIDDKEGKPVGIQQHIGRRPVFAAGNSDGDYQMLEWTTSGPGPRFGMIVHHTDSVREFAYDRDSHIGQLNKGLDDAGQKHWVIVDMAKDWKAIYP